MLSVFLVTAGIYEGDLVVAYFGGVILGAGLGSLMVELGKRRVSGPFFMLSVVCFILALVESGSSAGPLYPGAY